MKKVKDRSFSIIFKTVTLNFFNILTYYPKMVFMSHHKNRYSVDEKYTFSKNLIKTLLDTCKVKIEAYGLDNIPLEDGFYICANHQEKFDPLAIWYSFPRQVGVILNDEATHRPLIHEVCELVPSYKLKNNDVHNLVNCFSSITKSLVAGNNFLIFPEGWYESDYRTLSKFKAGCFKSPQRAHCPILPVALIDSYRIFDKGFKSTKPIQVHFLKPIQPEEYKNLKTDQIATLVQSRIQDVVNTYQN